MTSLRFLNMDGTPSGNLSHKAWPELGINDKCFGVHFIPNLDRKAKYMLLAAGLLPVSNFGFVVYFITLKTIKLSMYFCFFHTVQKVLFMTSLFKKNLQEDVSCKLRSTGSLGLLLKFPFYLVYLFPCCFCYKGQRKKLYVYFRG